MMASNVEQIEDEKKAHDEPLFCVGMIADVQYADADDGFNFSKTVRRRFRPSLKILNNAIAAWNAKDSNHIPSFVISLGDIIDILNSQKEPKESLSAIKTVLSAFNAFK